VEALEGGMRIWISSEQCHGGDSSLFEYVDNEEWAVGNHGFIVTLAVAALGLSPRGLFCWKQVAHGTFMRYVGDFW
jgi:hypothetical protein